MEDVLILAAALSVQDPRERPMDKAEPADAAHGKFRDENSDFIGFLRLWDAYHQKARELSGSRLRKWCQEQFVSFVRMREWHDIHNQLRELVAEIGLERRRSPSALGGEDRGEGYSARERHRHNHASASKTPHPHSLPQGERGQMHPLRYDAIHRALLAGLLANIGTKTDRFEYTGARNTKFNLFPGSGLFNSKPQWVMAAELVETTRLYARTAARIRPEWAERLGEHLVKRTYSDPHWNRQTAHVVAYEKVTLYGLTLVPRRAVHFGPIDPKQARAIFIQSALVDGDYDTTAPYFRHNQKLVDEINTLEAKRRSRDVMVDEKVRFDFYDARIPAGIHNGPAFEKWRRATEPANPRLLYMSRRDLMLHAAAETTADLFPDVISSNGVTVPLSYHFEPGHPADGVTARIPLAALNQVKAERFEWLVPGMLREKVTALIKSLPKPLRVNFVPAPDWAEKACAKLDPAGGASLYEGLALFLSRGTGVTVRPGDFDRESLLDHLHMNFTVVDDAGRPLASSRDLAGLRRQFGLAAREEFDKAPPAEGQFNRDALTRWDFGDLPESVEVKRHGLTLRGYPALEDRGESVSLRLVDTPEAAAQLTRGGLRRLFMLQTRQELAYIQRNIPGIDAMCLHFASIGSCDELRRQIAAAAADRALYDGAAVYPRTREEFAGIAEEAWRRLNRSAQEVAEVARRTLEAYHAVALQLQKPYPPLLRPSIEDMQRDLARLVPRDFLVSVPPAWMVHLPRFMKAIEIRLRKLTNAGLKRDQQAMQTIAPLWKRYEERLERHRMQGTVDPALEQYRWMMEELRVSLYAQELKTSVSVSAKRLDEIWINVK
jgi:ATP-dependent helicase HrpA